MADGNRQGIRSVVGSDDVGKVKQPGDHFLNHPLFGPPVSGQMQLDLHRGVLSGRKPHAGHRFHDHTEGLGDRDQGFGILEEENSFYADYIRRIFVDNTDQICA